MTHFQGGQISNKIFQWRSLTSDRHILDIIKGDRIDFITIPPINHYAINAIEVADETLVQSELDKLLSKGIIKKTFHEPVEYVSPIFITYKSDGGIRLILNLKNLNKSVEFIHFKMHTIRDVLQLIRKNCFMISIDLKDAYHTIKIREDFQCFLKFNFKDQLYNYTCYPNGLGPCPRKFTKVTSVPMAEVRKIGHPISGYIDDFIMIKMTKIACFEAGISTANMFQTLGFVIHPEKSQLEPTQKIIFLGFVIDSVTMTISLTEKRRNALHSLLLNILRLKSPTIRYVAKVIGHIISALPASKFGSLYYRDLENDKVVALQSNQGNFDAKMHISEAGIAEIKWWLSEINSLQNWILPPPITDELFCDASDYAWGGIYKLQKTGGAWLHSEISMHINAKEMMAIYFTLKSFSKQLQGKHVKIFSDNTSAVGIINKMGSSKSNICNSICQNIWLLCKKNEIWITCAHIPGTENVLADYESRREYRDSEWMLNPEIFKNITKKLNYSPEVDCFASRLNFQVEKYISFRPDPNAFLVNAFTVNWKGLNAYMFPPFSLIGMVLQKIRNDTATVLMIAPNWPTQPWFTTMREMMIAPPLYIKPGQKNLVLPSDVNALHPMWRKLTLVACILSH